MEVFRICRAGFATKLTSSGRANRWNVKGEQVIYTGASRSLATLELVVYKSTIQPVLPYKVMVISIADKDDLVKQINTKNLPVEWRNPNSYPYLQAIGSAWYSNKESLLLKVPSAIIPYEYNYIINTQHLDFAANVQLVRVEDYFWDERLLTQ